MEKYIYSADELIKTKPERLEGLNFSKDESTTITLNGVTVHADNYEIAYGRTFVILRFYKGRSLVACFDVFGSNEHKEDEMIIIDELGHLISQTNFRVMRNTIESLEE
ncbi:MAG: hypothetical protein IJA10_10855 [Lachnospiraceae bacterium]|nr:hypothetical protein [Lachnospiraceae bacterium]